MSMVFLIDKLCNSLWLVTVFESTFDDGVLANTLEGFHLCAEICARYNLPEVFDNLVVTLCKFSHLLQLETGSEEFILTFGSKLYMLCCTL